jgi:hypothetical protein
LPPKKNLKLSSARRSRDFGFSQGAFLAAFGGENRPNYFKNRPQLQKTGKRNLESFFKNLSK